ncbi:MAG: beta-propeller fold lactonase family protein [Nitrospirae bacterium]|nr:beta-propeller fold lactonase family protein [Candidatus Manganitrophaceae bacterium]
MRPRPSLSFLILLLCWISACGGDHSPSPPPAALPAALPVAPTHAEPGTAPPATSIHVTPDHLQLPIGGTAAFQAEVAGDPHLHLLWSIEEGERGGVITSEGIYTAPNQPGIYHVIATDPGSNATAGSSEITVMTPPLHTAIALSVSPAEITLHPAESQLFVAQITGSAASEVTWRIQEGASGGVIQSDGTYTAPAAAGTYHVVATSSVDPSATASATVTVIPKVILPRFAYAVNSISNDVSVFRIDSDRGVLTKLGSAPAGDHPYGLAADPSGRFLYAVNFGSPSQASTVSMYTIDPATGLLTATGEVNTGMGPYSVAVDPAGKFVYVANEDSRPQVWIYRINPVSGTLSSIGQIEAGTSSISITVDPLGRFVYVANTSSNTISVFRVDPATGLLSHVEEATAGLGANSVAVDPAGQFAYVANSRSNDVWWYQIDGSTGSLKKSGVIAAGTVPFAIAIDPMGRYAYTANSGSNDVSMYRIDSKSGALTGLGAIAASPDWTKQWGPRSVTVDPTGQFVYIANVDSNNLSAYQIDSKSGQLVPLGWFDAGQQTRAVTVIGGVN